MSTVLGQLRHNVPRLVGDYADIRFLRERALTIKVEGCDVQVQLATDGGGCCRVLRGATWTGASFNDLATLPTVCRQTSATARLLGEGGKATLAPGPVIEATVPLDLREDPRGVDLAAKVALCSRYAAVMGGGDRVTGARVTYRERFIRRWFVNSEGAAIDEEGADLSLACRALVGDGDRLERGQVDVGSAVDFNVFRNLEGEVAAAVDRARDLLWAATFPQGYSPVVLDPALSGTLVHEAVGHLLEADARPDWREHGGRPALGRQVAGPWLTVYDTADVPGARGGFRYDDEGMPARPVRLIDRGSLAGLLHTRETAGAYGVPPTGNARAVGYRYFPLPRMRTTCIAGGDRPLAGLLREATGGVYLRRAYGGQTEGTSFSFAAAEAYRIEDGRVGEPLRGVTVAGNTLELLASVAAVGNDWTLVDGPIYCGKQGQYPLCVSMAAPHVRLSRIKVGSR